MPELVMARLATSTVMGQQAYESAIGAGAAAELGAGWRVREQVVRSLRAPLAGTMRLPAILLGDATAAARRAAGRIVFRGADVAHRMDLRLPPAPHEVVTIHDVVSWRFPDEGHAPRATPAELRRAAAVIAPSQFSAREVAELFGIAEPIAIHNGIDPAFFTATPLDADALAELGIRAPFVLTAGGCTQRKNLAGLAAAWPAVHAAHPGVQLVLIGPPDPRRERLFAPLPATVRPGRVSGEQVRGLMAAAEAVVVPSLYEGFGLPALEAMACGTPVVAADRGSLPEVCGDAALLVEPDGAGLAEGLISALDAGPEVRALAERGRMRAGDFSWAASTRRHAEIWKSLAR